ncbi:MAG TPA: hypothetical protein VF844_12635 [Ktedonobacteraceae bacterium]
MNVSQTSTKPPSWHHTFITILDDNRPAVLNEAEADGFPAVLPWVYSTTDPSRR